MNTREAMAALLDGKRIRQDHHNREVYFELDERGEIRNHRGDFLSLLGTWSHRQPAEWRLFEEPNPHTPGTFAWAREEAKRGRRVYRRCAPCLSFRSFSFEPHQPWALEHVDATDWEVVS